MGESENTFDNPKAPFACTAAPQVAAFFDLDKTIIASSSALAFSKPFLQQGLISRRAALKSAYAQLVFSLSGADAHRTERLRAEISAMSAGWNVNRVTAVVRETLHDVVTPLIHAEAAELIKAHKEDAHDVIVLSATGEEVVFPIAEMLGATHSRGSRMGIVDGHYSGQLDFYCYGEQKAVAAKQLAAEHGYDLTASYAYTDSSTDIPLLESVGHPHVVNPDRVLRRTAIKRGWPIHSFAHPVPLHERMPTPSPKTAALGLSIGAIAAGIAMYGKSRKQQKALV